MSLKPSLQRHAPVESKLNLSRPEESFFRQVEQSIARTTGRELNWRMGTPSEGQLALINRYKPRGMDNYQSNELVTIPWLASHSLMQHGGGCWSPEAVMEMAFMAPGNPVLVDHNWDEVGASHGYIYEAHIVEVESAVLTAGGSDFDPIVWASAGSYVENNLDILRRNGSGMIMILETAHQAGSAFVEAVKFNRIRACSTGCMMSSDGYVCPTCTDSQGEYVGFSDDRCPHIMPSPFLSWFVDVDNPEIQKLIAPYYIKHGIQDFIELSAVVAPGLPGARRLEG